MTSYMPSRQVFLAFMPCMRTSNSCRRPAAYGSTDSFLSSSNRQTHILRVGYHLQYSAERLILHYAQNNDFRPFKLGTLDNNLGNTKERTLFQLIRSDRTVKSGDTDTKVDQSLGSIADWSPLAIYGLDWDQTASAKGLKSR